MQFGRVGSVLALVAASLVVAPDTPPAGATPPAGSGLVGVRACTIADTRRAGGILTTTPRTLRIAGTNLAPQGGDPDGCGIPEGATAAILTLTLLEATGPGALRIGPTLTNSLRAAHYQPGPPTTTTLTLPLTAAGTLTTRAETTPTHLLARITAYHTRRPPTAGLVGVRACTIADTRRAGGMLTATPRTLRIAGTNLAPQGGDPDGCRIPEGATAAILTLTLLEATGPGALRIGPTLTNSLRAAHYQPGPPTTTTLTLPLTAAGTLTTRAETTPTHLLARITAYHTRRPPTAGLVGVRACTIADTRRAGGMLTATPRTLRITGTNLAPQGGDPDGCGIPEGATAATLTLTLLEATGPGALRIGPTLTNSLRAAHYQPGPPTTTTLTLPLTATGTLTTRAETTPTHLLARITAYHTPFTPPPPGPGTTTLVSVSSAGAVGNGESLPGESLSADGRYVAFASAASNLVPGDTNGKPDVFVHDRHTRRTTRVSVSGTGRQANGVATMPVMSADGRYVAFTSDASNLVPGDTNRCGRPGLFRSCPDVFVHDRQTGETTRVSVSGTGAQGDDVSEPAALSADGRFVAFTSAASNLVPGDTNQCGPKGFFRSCPDAFVHDRQTGETVRVSVTGTGAQGDGLSIAAGLSADGRHVAFTSTAPNLVPGDTNRCGSIPFTQAWGISGGLPARATGPDASSGPGTCPDAFVHDRLTGATSRISVSSSGRQGDDFSYAGALSADGRHVVFTSQASNLVPGDTNATGDVFVHDRWARRTTRVSVSSTGRQGGRESRGTALSADGRYVAFLSWASNLVPGDVNDAEDAFVHDRRTGRTVQVSVSSRGVPGDDETFEPAMSADGRTVAFASFATNLVAPRVVRCRTPRGEPYLCPHTFVHERPG